MYRWLSFIIWSSLGFILSPYPTSVSHQYKSKKCPWRVLRLGGFRGWALAVLVLLEITVLIKHEKFFSRSYCSLLFVCCGFLCLLLTGEKGCRGFGTLHSMLCFNKRTLPVLYDFPNQYFFFLMKNVFKPKAKAKQK